MDAAVKQLHQHTTSNVPALLVNLVLLFGCVALLATGWPTEHWLWTCLVIVVMAYVQHCWMMILHEDAHYTLYQARWHNILNGTIIGTVIGIPFEIYRQVHIRHHSKMNEPDDWELWPYNDPNTSVNFRRWFLFWDFAFPWVGIWVYNRIFFVKDSPLREPKARGKIWRQFLLIGLFWGAVLGLVAWQGWWWELMLLYVFPSWLTGFIQTGRKLTEHLGLPAGDALGGARTILSKGPIERLLAWMNFHIEVHGLHHKFPQMPHYNLARAHELLGVDEHGPTFSSWWGAIRDVLPHFLSPGIGVNAPPARKEPEAVATAPIGPTPA